jgi:hypothetical protein
MTELDTFLPNIKLYAPGVADPTAYFAIRQAAIDFCERTRAWRFDDEFDITVDDAEGLLAPSGSVVHDIEGVWFEGTKLKPKTPVQLDTLVPNWRSGATKVDSTPKYVTQTEPNTIVLVPFLAGSVKLSLFLKPAQDADELPDFIADQHRETIAWGALGRILLIPNQSFTNVEMGSAFGQMFQQKIDGKSTMGSIGQQRAPIRTKASFL